MTKTFCPTCSDYVTVIRCDVGRDAREHRIAYLCNVCGDEVDAPFEDGGERYDEMEERRGR